MAIENLLIGEIVDTAKSQDCTVLGVVCIDQRLAVVMLQHQLMNDPQPFRVTSYVEGVHEFGSGYYTATRDMAEGEFVVQTQRWWRDREATRQRTGISR